MFLSAGNMLVNPAVGLLFISFESGRRMRLNGEASIDEHERTLTRLIAKALNCVGPDEQPEALPLGDLHRVPVRVANRPRRATIWSARMTLSRSSALCSAARVAYSLLTTSIPTSDPAVASSTTAPVAASTKR